MNELNAKNYNETENEIMRRFHLKYTSQGPGAFTSCGLLRFKTTARLCAYCSKSGC